MNFLKRGRKKLFDNRILLPLTEQMLGDIDTTLAGGESRVDFIRHAIEAKIMLNRCETSSHGQSATRMLGTPLDDEDSRHLRASITEVGIGDFRFVCELYYWGGDTPSRIGSSTSLEDARKQVLAIAAHDIWANIVVCNELPQTLRPSDPSAAPAGDCTSYIRINDAFTLVERGPASDAEKLLDRAVERYKGEIGAVRTAAAFHSQNHEKVFSF
jgi:hypothetical protein